MISLFNKIRNWLVLGFFVLAIINGFFLNKTVKEKSRLNKNQAALMEEVALFKTSDSLNAASVQGLTLKVGELKSYNSELTEKIESLHIELKRVQAASVTTVITEYKPVTVIKDSIVYVESGLPDTLKCIEYKDPWIDIDGCFHLSDTEFTPQIVTRDTLIQVIDRVPRKFLFIPYGVKAIRQTVVTNNRWSKPVYTEYIELKKR